MSTPTTAAHFPDPGDTVDETELSRLCGLSLPELRELRDYGALAPTGGGEGTLRFGVHWLAPLRTALRLRADFELDLFTVALLLDYLQRITALEQELATLRARLPARLHH